MPRCLSRVYHNKEATVFSTINTIRFHRSWKMSSKDYYHRETTRTSANLRRSKRLTRYASQRPRSKITRKGKEKVGKQLKSKLRMGVNRKLTKEREEKLKKKPVEQKSEIFSGDPLSQEELDQLLIKYKNDGHFYHKLSDPTARPAFITGQKNEELKTAKEENEEEVTEVCGRRSFETDGDENGISSRTTSELSVTLSNPLPSASGSTLHISTNNGQYIPPIRSSIQKNSNGITISRNFLSSASYRAGNGVDSSSDKNLMSPVTPSKFLPTLDPLKTVFNGLNTNFSWKSFEHGNKKEDLQNHKDSNSHGFYCGGNDSRIAYYDNNSINNRTNYSNRESIDNSYRNFARFPYVSHNNSCETFNENGNAPDFYNERSISFENSTLLGQNESSYGNLSNNWNGTDQNISNTFTNINSSIDDPNDPQNSINYVSSSVLEYDSAIKSSNDDCSHAFDRNANSSISSSNDPSGYSSSLMTWNNVQIFQNSCTNEGPLPYVKSTYNCPVTSGIPISPLIFNDPNNFNDHANYWSQNNSTNTEFFMIDDPENDSTILANNFPNKMSLPMTITNPTTGQNTEIMTMKNRNTDKSSFEVNNFSNSQGEEFCPIISSFYSYDDDIGYEKYTNDTFNNNSVSTTNHFNQALNNDLLAKIQAEVRPVYNSSMNCSQFNNDSRKINDNSSRYDFETKKESVGSPDCIILENSMTV